jgi:hypothetical protein
MGLSFDKVQMFIKVGDEEIEVQPADGKIEVEVEDYPDIEVEGFPFDLEMELKRELQSLYDAGASREELVKKADKIIRTYNEKMIAKEFERRYKEAKETISNGLLDEKTARSLLGLDNEKIYRMPGETDEQFRKRITE